MNDEQREPPDIVELPESVRKALSEPPPDTPLPPGKSKVSSAQLAKDLDYNVGDKAGFAKLKVEHRTDPCEELKAPLVKHPDRRFFYAGLLHAYCRIDSMVTERYRAQKEIDVSSWVHYLEHPIVEIPSAPAFSQTRVAYTLQSLDAAFFRDFVGFVCSNNIVDRKRSRVWFVDAVEVKILDPYMVDAKEPPHETLITVFCPKTSKGKFVPEATSGFFVGIPRIVFEPGEDPMLEDVTKGILDVR